MTAADLRAALELVPDDALVWVAGETIVIERGTWYRRVTAASIVDEGAVVVLRLARGTLV